MPAAANPALAEHVEALLADAPEGGLDRTAADLAAVARVAAREPRLRRALADPGLPAEVKRALLGDLGGGRLDRTAVALLASLAERQRVEPRDLGELLVELVARASFAAAQAAGELERVEDDLFRFGSLLEREGRLRLALTNPGLPAEPKRALLAELLQGKADPRTLELLELLVDLVGGRDADAWTRRLAALAAERRQRVVAEVRTAVPLDPSRQAALARALEGVTGRQVELRLRLDESILGAVVVRIGDEVFDGSVRSRIEQARERLGVA
jgi:F-type H+-transporting ATPase subunit delta